MRRQPVRVELRLDGELKARYQGRYLSIGECGAGATAVEPTPRNLFAKITTREARVPGCKASSIAPVRRCGPRSEAEEANPFCAPGQPGGLRVPRPKPRLQSFTRSRTRPLQQSPPGETDR